MKRMQRRDISSSLTVDVWWKYVSVISFLRDQKEFSEFIRICNDDDDYEDEDDSYNNDDGGGGGGGNGDGDNINR